MGAARTHDPSKTGVRGVGAALGGVSPSSLTHPPRRSRPAACGVARSHCRRLWSALHARRSAPRRAIPRRYAGPTACFTSSRSRTASYRRGRAPPSQRIRDGAQNRQYAGVAPVRARRFVSRDARRRRQSELEDVSGRTETTPTAPATLLRASGLAQRRLPGLNLAARRNR